MTMRRLAVVVVFSSLLVGCGDGDDPPSGSSIDSAVVRSSDGRAELVLPAGVDGEGITVEPIEVAGAAAAYELLPSGTTFDDPATLTISDLEVAEPGAFAIGIIDGEAVVDTEAVHDPNGTATVTMAVPHFSSASVWFRSSTGQKRYFGSASFYVPREVQVDRPFETDARWSQPSDRMVFGEDLEVEFTSVRLRGRFTADNATPSVVDDVPPLGPAEPGVVAHETFRCGSVGPLRMAYFAFVEVEYVQQLAGKETRGSFTGRSRFTSDGRCVTTTTTTKSFTDTTRSGTNTTRPEHLAPIVTEIRVDLRVPVTTYTVTAEAAPGDDANLFYLWEIVGESCGTPKTPFSRSLQTVTWSHADAPPDSCRHASTDHDITASVKVFTSNGGTQCVIHGTESQVIRNPVCQTI